MNCAVCDRCGRRIGKNSKDARQLRGWFVEDVTKEDDNARVPRGFIGEVNDIPNKTSFIYRRYLEFDLCEDCAQKLVKWLKIDDNSRGSA